MSQSTNKAHRNGFTSDRRSNLIGFVASMRLPAPCIISAMKRGWATSLEDMAYQDGSKFSVKSVYPFGFMIFVL